MVEVRFKPSDVGSVADGSITSAKLADGAVIDAKVASISQAKVTNLVTDLANKANAVDVADKVGGVGTTGDKKILAIGYDSLTNEVVIEHEA